MAVKKAKKTASHPIDREKEAVLNELVDLLADQGLVVRRERLKQGPGWKVMSGACRLNDDSLIFVDRRLTQDEQIGFLVSRLLQAEVKLPKERLASLPPVIQHQLSGTD